MKNFINSLGRIDLLIVLVSMILMAVVLKLPFKAKPFGDEYSFFDESKNLAFYLKGTLDFEKVTITKAPAPILIYTPVFLLTPENPSNDDLWYRGVALNFILITVSLMLIYRTTVCFFNHKVGLLSFLLFFAFPIHFYYVFGITAEVPAFFASSLVIFSWSKIYFNSTKTLNYLFFGFAIWLLIMCRPNTLLILVLGFLVLLYSYFKRKDFFNEFGLKLFLTFIVCGVTCFSTLKLVNMFNSGKQVFNQEGLFYYVAHQGRYQFREEPLDFRFWDDEIRPDSEDYKNWKIKANDLELYRLKSGKSNSEVYKEYLINDIIENPLITIRQFLVKSIFGQVYIVNSITPQKFHIGPFKGTICYWIFIFSVNLVNILILIGTLVFLYKTKDLIKFWPLWTMVLALLLFHGMMYMEPRYMFPARVCLYVMSAAGLYRINGIAHRLNLIAKFVFPNKTTTSP